MLINDRYEIIEKIGAGGMSVVYKARCTKLERFVAIKVLREEFCLDDEFVKRFKIEAQSAARLSNSNIVNIYDVGNDKKLHYIVMEYLEGKTLKEYIKEKGKLSDAETVNIAACIASALDQAHENHIIHRDIKPQNIIITVDNKVKVADFGIAKVATDATIAASDTATGSVHYIAPEQARGGYCDERSDIYSLGITMFEMLTGEVPFNADTAVSVALKQIHDELPNIIDKAPETNKNLEQIIKKATSKKPELRYQRASELLSDLKTAHNFPDEEFNHVNKFEDDSPTIIMNTDEINEHWDKNKRMNLAPKKPENSKSKTDKKIAMMGIGAALIAVFIVTFIFFNLVGEKLFSVDVIVPDLEGLTLEDAKDLLKDNKLKYKIVDEEYSVKYDENYVVSQEPVAGTEYKSGRTIEIVISKGREKTVAPNLIGLEYTKAEEKLISEGLISDRQSEYSASVPIGIVIRQEPTADSDIKKGDAIKIYVSLGEETKFVLVPDIRNEKEDRAIAILKNAGLNVGNIMYVNHDVVEKGNVVSMTSEAGKQVEMGYSIDLAISKGPEVRKTTRTITINNILDFGQVEGRVRVVLFASAGEEILFDRIVDAGEFPLTISATGSGRGTFDVYLDSVKQYTGQLNFD